jgi:peptidoglycan/xylan/chitin deacetylase (PgdA/CDA1 family)
MDDVGASTKEFEQHGRVRWRVFGREVPLAFFANWLFFKRIRPFAQWGVYQELSEEHWIRIFTLLQQHDAKLTVGVTACWAVSQDELIPFDKKYPSEASILKEGSQEGIVEIANHGLCHCALNDNLFHPHMFTSNRVYHREFFDMLPDSYHKEHIDKSQEILMRIFKKDIITFIPPGNVWSDATERFAKEAGIKYLSSLEDKAPTGQRRNGITYVGNKNMIDFHDREISLWGTDWLDSKMEMASAKYCTVRDYFDE